MFAFKTCKLTPIILMTTWLQMEGDPCLVLLKMILLVTLHKKTGSQRNNTATECGTKTICQKDVKKQQQTNKKKNFRIMTRQTNDGTTEL